MCLQRKTLCYEVLSGGRPDVSMTVDLQISSARHNVKKLCLYYSNTSIAHRHTNKQRIFDTLTPTGGRTLITARTATRFFIMIYKKPPRSISEYITLPSLRTGTRTESTIRELLNSLVIVLFHIIVSISYNKYSI